jgi:uncharacterized protein YjcR
MTEKNQNTAEYGHFFKLTDEAIIEKIHNIDEDSCSLSLKSMLEIAKFLNLDIRYEMCR